MKKIILLLVIFTSSLFSQAEYSRKRNSGQLLPNFFIDLATYKGKDSTTSKLDFFIKTPYSNIQFLKKDDGYEAKYTVTVSLFDEEGETIKVEKLWNEKIFTKIFKQTSSASSYNISYKTINVLPGKYKLVCTVEDLESNKHSSYEQKITIKEFKDSLDLSDIVLVSQFVETNEGKKIIPNISNLVTSQDSSVMFFYHIYSSSEQNVNIEYAIVDKDDKSIFIKRKEMKVSKGKNIVYETLNNITFALGQYKVIIKLQDEENELISGTGKVIKSKIYGFPSFIKSLDLAIDQMQYIASTSDVDKIMDAENYKDKLNSYLKYWKSLDPSPNTVENEMLNNYYARVAYANANFKSYYDGWRTDMGMVYITLGPPNQVTRRPYELSTKPYEVWDYYTINRSFIFVDVTNFGDFRLQNQMFGDWFRYRP
ncbi:MAG: GWxTD domain-containing protein [Melioribacteraceae bacterium]